MSKMTGNNRISALKRLSNPSSINNRNNRSLIGSKNSSIKDARQILTNKPKTSFDARQLLSRQSSTNNEDMVVITGLKDMKMKDGRLIPTTTIGNAQAEKKKKIFAVGPSTFVTIRNSNNNPNVSLNQSTEKISFTKTITNSSARREDDDRNTQSASTLSSSSSLNQKVVISFVNDKYQKNPPPSTIPKSSSPIIHHRDSPPRFKRLHDASMQTISSSSSSRSPIRISSHRRQNSTMIDEQDYSNERTIGDDLYEPAVKRTTSSARKTTTTTEREQQIVSTSTSTGSVKRTSTGAPVSSRMSSSVSTVSKQQPTTQSSSTPATILVTNLLPSVSEEDVIELFGQIGRINEITTLSQGCIQIIYAKREHGEQAVTKYHNRLLDGQFMYVSLQQTSSNTKPTNNTPQPTKENGTSNNSSSTTNQPLKFNANNNNNSNKITIDPAFIRQALFHPSNNTTNPVQFQVKL